MLRPRRARRQSKCDQLEYFSCTSDRQYSYMFPMSVDPQTRRIVALARDPASRPYLHVCPVAVLVTWQRDDPFLCRLHVAEHRCARLQKPS